MTKGHKCYTWTGETIPLHARAFHSARDNWERVLAVLGFFGMGTWGAVADNLSWMNQLIWNRGKLVLILGSLLGGACTVGLWLAHVLRRTRLEQKLHAFAHHTRDDILKFIDSGSLDAKDIRWAFTQIISRMTDIFKVALRNQDLEAVLWIAEGSAGGQYVLFANTSGADAQLCGPIQQGNPLVSLLCENCNLRGIIHILDARTLSLDDEWREVRANVGTSGCAAFVPINIWEGGEKCLGGLLLIKCKDRFQLRHIELVMACADILGLAYKSLELTRAAFGTKNAAAGRESSS